MDERAVPNALRAWFIVHFAVDVLFAIPLMVAPEAFLGALGWRSVDPIAARLVAAALLGIGIESYLGRDQGVEAYRGMLRLKIIWSSAAILGIGWSLLAGAQGVPLVGWIVLAVFLAFNLLWVYWYRGLAGRA